MPTSTFNTSDPYTYQEGFGNYHQTEATPDTLSIGQNSPQQPAHGLYIEKLSGTAFTAPRCENRQAWLHRILPSAAHSPFEQLDDPKIQRRATSYNQIPNQMRWDPFDFDADVDWVHGLHPLAGAGDPAMRNGMCIYVFAAGRNMGKEAFYSADGDFLIVPQHGILDIQTEMGMILVRANEICIIPRGVRYRVMLPQGPVRGYICEIYRGHFQLPDLGPIGSNGLANARDFQAPVAHYDVDDDTEEWRLITKFNNNLFVAVQNHTPFDVVAWHGTYYPYKYDLGRFNTIGSISFDHPDPSIFTVLTAPSETAGTALADFVIFPPRWLVSEGTFRPPWYHRNSMSEFMGLIAGDYDAKTGGGFRPAGASLHNIMSAHGPDTRTHASASTASLVPQKVGSGSMAFMFESYLMVGLTEWGLKTCEKVQQDYNQDSWGALESHYIAKS